MILQKFYQLIKIWLNNLYPLLLLIKICDNYLDQNIFKSNFKKNKKKIDIRSCFCENSRIIKLLFLIILMFLTF